MSFIIICLFIAFSVLFFLFRSRRKLFSFAPKDSPSQTTKEIIDILEKAELSSKINAHDKQLIESVVNFRKRIAREVMVPRIEVFALSAETSIRDAAELLRKEGYSRTPIYKGSIDNIVSILMYKDVIEQYMKYVQEGSDSKILDAPIEAIGKPVLYTPEMKKLSNLLQEFRKKQMHFAVVVDEYGSTEGIITIEDILEEIVGEISDEYDDEEEEPIKQLSHRSWNVDARMNVFDVEEQLHISIPQEGEYDTIGGYIYNRAGGIPSKGFTIHHDDFEIEVIRSNERAVETVRIKKRDEKDFDSL